MPNSASRLAVEINDQYFTPIDTAKWCFEEINRETGWEFEGTALEPCVGAFAFVQAAEQLGLCLQWTTNDLFPQEGLAPDTQEDLRNLSGSFDYVITNPPFGYANGLARTALKHSLSLAPRVLMVLPKGARRLGFKDAMPRYTQMVVDKSLPNEAFTTSNGEVRQVKTCVQAWEETDAPRPLLKDGLDLRDDLFVRWSSAGPKWADGMDLQVVRWGAMGQVVPPERERRSGALQSVRLKGISREEFCSVQSALDFSDFEDMCSSAPAFDVPVWVHRFNNEAVRRGLLPPL